MITLIIIISFSSHTAANGTKKVQKVVDTFECPSVGPNECVCGIRTQRGHEAYGWEGYAECQFKPSDRVKARLEVIADNSHGDDCTIGLGDENSKAYTQNVRSCVHPNKARVGPITARADANGIVRLQILLRECGSLRDTPPTCQILSGTELIVAK